MTDEEGSERGTYFTADEDDDGQGKRAGEVPAVIRDDAVPQGSGNGVSGEKPMGRKGWWRRGRRRTHLNRED